MSGRDEQDPIHNPDLPGTEPPDPIAPNPDIPSSDASSDELVAAPAFHLPAVPIAPTRAINAPASHALASGDDLLDFVSNPLRHPSPKRAQHMAFPDDLDPELLAMPLPSDPNRPVSRPLSADTRADRLTDPLRPEASESQSDSALEQFPAPDFPITPFAPFVALPPDAAESPHTSGAPGPGSLRTGLRPGGGDPSHLGTWESNEAAGAPGPSHLGTWELNEAPGAPGPSHLGTWELDEVPPPNFRLDPEPVTRIPNFGHLAILLAIASIGFVVAGLLIRLAFHFHLWGVKTIAQAADDIHYTLLSMAILYVTSFAIAFFFFARLWQKPFFAALQWNAPAARRNVWLLFAAAAFCFVLAMVDELILPGPTNAPIDKMFSNTSAAWLLFAFGVTVAPFFEEMTFRGFLLPALCTAVDWALSLRTKPSTSFLDPTPARRPMPPLGPNGHPQWSLPAMIIGSLLTSLPFAAMHADQIAHAIGPLALLYCVSLILCFARLATRSLAASTLLHAFYNFLLFSLMLIGTSGFKHLDKM